MGLQGTNYPISYPEQKSVLEQYMKLLFADGYNPKMHSFVKNTNFIGPNSYTLQLSNIVPTNNESNIPNIRTNYTVTDKADGERHMMFINEKGKIYLLNTNMQVLFTGSITENKELFNTLVDGEIVLHNKYGKFINLYAAFDVYFLNKIDVRALGFVPRKPEDNPFKFRLPLLKNIMTSLNAISIIPGEDSPIRFESKRFYPINPNDSIFSACNFILNREKEGGFEYETDGLIFTHVNFGVGSDKIGQSGPLKRTVWDYSFKWKPPQYNTIDFLVKSVKAENGQDKVTTIFQDGLNAASMNQLVEYKTLILCVGYDPNQHGYINPCQDVLEDKFPTTK